MDRDPREDETLPNSIKLSDIHELKNDIEDILRWPSEDRCTEENENPAFQAFKTDLVALLEVSISITSDLYICFYFLLIFNLLLES